MGDALTQLGIGGVFALLVIREVLNFLAKRKPANHNPGNPGNSAHAMKLMANEQTEIRKIQTDILSAIVRVETIVRERLPKA